MEYMVSKGSNIIARSIVVPAYNDLFENTGELSAASLRRQNVLLPLEIRQDACRNRPTLTTNSHDSQHTPGF